MMGLHQRMCESISCSSLPGGLMIPMSISLNTNLMPPFKTVLTSCGWVIQPTSNCEKIFSCVLTRCPCESVRPRKRCLPKIFKPGGAHMPLQIVWTKIKQLYRSKQIFSIVSVTSEAIVNISILPLNSTIQNSKYRILDLLKFPDMFKKQPHV